MNTKSKYKTRQRDILIGYLEMVSGKHIHLHCEELAMIQGHLMEHHQFLLNPMRTVFYGVCEQCAGKGTGNTVE